MDYISRIKQVKNEKKITNEKLSELTGIPLSTVSKILAGISDSPKLSNMVLIARALDCTLDYIVSGTPQNNNNYTLTDKEIEFIETYRQLDFYGKDLVEVGVTAEHSDDAIVLADDLFEFLALLFLADVVGAEEDLFVIQLCQLAFEEFDVCGGICRT